MAKLVHRTLAFKAESVDDDGTFTGYGSAFGVTDSYGDVVMPGAFKQSLKRIKKSGAPLPALWQHRSDQPIGGYSELSEDDFGLRVEGFLLIDSIPLAKQAHVLMKEKIVRGLSIGYYIEDGFFNEKAGIYELRKLDLVEISPVTFPANVEAQIDGVKSIRDMISAGAQPTPRDFEDFLREAGFSKTQAAAITGGGYTKLFRGEPGGDKVEKQVLDVLSNFKL